MKEIKTEEKIDNGIPSIEDIGLGYYKYYPANGINALVKSLDIVNSVPDGAILYVANSGISQSKIRESGFKITRNKTKADFLVHESLGSTYGETHEYTPSVYDFTLCRRINTGEPRECYTSSDNADKYSQLKELYHDQNHTNNKFKYILSKDLYSSLYKYEGDQKLYNTLDPLLFSNDRANHQMAMEFMANANWAGNEIYLKTMMYDYYTNKIRGHSYKNSVSFKGFLSTLDFNYERMYLHNAESYKYLCLNEEQHDWVFNKFKNDLDNELKDLAYKFKINIDELKISIDKDGNKNQKTIGDSPKVDF